MPSNVIVHNLAGALAGETCVVKLYDSRRNGSISVYFRENLLSASWWLGACRIRCILL